MPSSPLPLLREHYPVIAKDLIGPLLEVLWTAREACGGDLDKFYVVLVVAMRSAEDRRVASLNFDEVLSGAVSSYPSLTTNIRSVSESTGVPKETVRRKVAALIADGWIRRDGNNLSFTPHATRMLTKVREPLLAFAASSYQTVVALNAR
ncbi:MAG: hypothetical protein JWQ52_2372 [Phenylobacterium sp.]|jgi:hypothetical protein|nr:hypothetical protein [Phenylobacterium sp.]